MNYDKARLARLLIRPPRMYVAPDTIGIPVTASKCSYHYYYYLLGNQGTNWCVVVCGLWVTIDD